MSWFRRLRWSGRGAAGPLPPLPPLPPMPAPAPALAAVQAGKARVPVLRDPAEVAAEAERAGDWGTAAAAYRALVTARPDAALWKQLARALTRAGAATEAEQAYAGALSLAPRDADALHERGQLLMELGRRGEAIACFSAALDAAPQRAASRRALLHLGARDLLPLPGTAAAKLADLRALDAAAARGFEALQDWAAAAGYPLAAYDRFRREMPIRPPPGPLPAPSPGEVTIVVDALAATPARLRATLRSLSDQSVREWRGIVLASDEVRDHPVASLAGVDGRFRFVAAVAPADEGRGRWWVSVSAGTMLHHDALAWLLFALTRTGGVAVTADHDRAVEHWSGGMDHHAPAIGGACDPDLLRQTDDPPPLVVAEAARAASLAATGGDAATWGAEWRRAVLLRALEEGSVPHVPRLLSSVLDLPVVATQGRAGADDGVPGRLSTPPAVPASAAPPSSSVGDERLLVVVPTRDEAALLRACLGSLRRLAERPDRIDIAVVNNRSREGETQALLAEEAARGTRVLTMDAPFNWSLANELAVRDGAQANLLFLNNDVELLAAGWDRLLVDALQRPGIGAVGARLLYPDHSIQHAGILMGVDRGLPVHDGRDAARDDEGPGGRWRCTRRVAALTGAFLGVRRDTFKALGGFDPLFAVGYNDIDFSLRVRERGLACLFLPAIEAVHHESRTRGQNDTKARVAWDQGELADLRRRWGRSLAQDPTYSPFWAIGGQPFDGLREPPTSEIVRFIDLTGRADPWLPLRREAHEAAEWAAGAPL